MSLKRQSEVVVVEEQRWRKVSRRIRRKKREGNGASSTAEGRIMRERSSFDIALAAHSKS